MAPQRIGEVTFGSLHEKFRLFNLHDRSHVAHLVELLSQVDSAAPRIVLLSGERASGRRYLLEAAVFEARDAGVELELADLDLEGFDESAPNFKPFLLYQFAKRGAAGWGSDVASLKGDLKAPATRTSRPR